MIEQLHQTYGKLMIDAEIIQAKIQEVKSQIAREMSKPVEPMQPVEKKDDKK